MCVQEKPHAGPVERTPEGVQEVTMLCMLMASRTLQWNQGMTEKSTMTALEDHG